MGGRKKVLVMLKVGGGGTKRNKIVLTRELEVLAIVIGGAKSIHPLIGGAQKVLPCLEARGWGWGGEGGCNKFRTRDFPIL